MTINPRLAHLLELADKGPALRAALAEEVAGLLCEWPSDCSADMRPVFENLLAKAAREVDGATRSRLRVRMFAAPELSARLLPREKTVTPLIETARQGGALAPLLAETLGLDALRAGEILQEQSGEALAIACKGAGIGRAAFSTLVLLALPQGTKAADRLAVYDRVPALEAARTLRAWRGARLHAAE